MTERTLVHEFIDHTDGDKVFAKVWWDGKKIRTDNNEALRIMEDRTAFGLTMSDGPEYLRKLPSMFNNGYMSVRKAKETQ